MFAGDLWTFERVGGGEVTVKLCWCCACHHLKGNPKLNDNRRDGISSTTVISGLKIKSDAKGDTVFELAAKDDKVIDEDQFLMASGHQTEDSLLAEAEGVTHNLDDDGAKTGKMPAS